MNSKSIQQLLTQPHSSCMTTHLSAVTSFKFFLLTIKKMKQQLYQMLQQQCGMQSPPLPSLLQSQSPNPHQPHLHPYNNPTPFDHHPSINKHPHQQDQQSCSSLIPLPAYPSLGSIIDPLTILQSNIFEKYESMVVGMIGWLEGEEQVSGREERGESGVVGEGWINRGWGCRGGGLKGQGLGCFKGEDMEEQEEVQVEQGQREDQCVQVSQDDIIQSMKQSIQSMKQSHELDNIQSLTHNKINTCSSTCHSLTQQPQPQQPSQQQQSQQPTQQQQTPSQQPQPQPQQPLTSHHHTQQSAHRQLQLLIKEKQLTKKLLQLSSQLQHTKTLLQSRQQQLTQTSKQLNLMRKMLEKGNFERMREERVRGLKDKIEIESMKRELGLERQRDCLQLMLEKENLMGVGNQGGGGGRGRRAVGGRLGGIDRKSSGKSSMMSSMKGAVIMSPDQQSQQNNHSELVRQQQTTSIFYQS